MNYKLIKDPLSNEIYMVKKTSVDSVTGQTNKLFIPFAEANTDYQEYLMWVAEGNTADPAD